MAAGDAHGEGAPVASGAGQDDTPAPLREAEAAGEQTATNHAPVAPDASEEESVPGSGGAGKEDARGTQEGREEAEGGQEDDENAEEDEEERDGKEEGEEGDEEEEEEAPTHLPFAPTEDLLDDTTTVDPSYTISLIRQLIPKGSNVEKEFTDKQGVPEERSANSDDGESTQPDKKDPSEKSDEQGFPEERSVNSDGESAQPDNKDPWEECGCILWDLAASKSQAELMINNLVLEVLLSNLQVTKSTRVKEICLGIMGNLACHESLVNAICLENGLIATVVEQLFLDDTGCLSETFRLLTAILRSSASVSWAEALLPEKILSRILWIVGNTMNSTLLEKSIDFISTVIDDQDVIAMLIQPLLKVGLVDYAIGLLTTEIEKSPDEKLDRSGSLDLILHFMEELSAIHSVSEVMSSSDQLIKVLVNMVKSPDKLEVASYGASVVIIIANILADGNHLVPMLSHDLPFLEGLFDILPLVPDDNQARYALWCSLSRFLAQAQEIEMDSLSLDQFASLFLGRFTLIKDDVDSHVFDEEENLSAEDAYVKGWISTCLRAISFVMERWIAKKSSQSKEDTPLTGTSIDNAWKLLGYCQKMLH